MVETVNERTGKLAGTFAKFLNDKQFTRRIVLLEVVPDQEVTVGDMRLGLGLGVFLYRDGQEKILVVSPKACKKYMIRHRLNLKGSNPEEILFLSTIAHQYKHFLQHSLSRFSDFYDEETIWALEDEAEKFASQIVNEFLSQICDT